MIREEFKKYDDNYFLMSVIKTYHIYRREHKDGRLVGYEIMKPINMNGEMTLPSASFWGIYGWSYRTELGVVQKMKELLTK